MGPCRSCSLRRHPGLVSALKVTRQAEREDPGLGGWPKGRHRRQEVGTGGGLPGHQSPPFPHGNTPLRSDVLMLSTETEIETERYTKRETMKQTHREMETGGTGRQADRDIKGQAEAQRKAASPSETHPPSQEHTQRPLQHRVQAVGTTFLLPVTLGLTHLRSHSPHTHSL